jgi:hypothetical protein
MGRGVAADISHNTLLPLNDWRVGSNSVEEILSLTRAAIEDKDPGAVVYQHLDNSCFYGRTRDRSRTAAKVGPDGEYNLEGEVTVCSKDTQLEHLNAIKPLLEITNKKKCLLLMPCYVPGLCAAHAGLSRATPQALQGFSLL